MARVCVFVGSLALLGALACGGFVERPNAPGPGRAREATTWGAYGGGPAGLRFSSLADIDAGNVEKLEVAWTYRHGDLEDDASPLGVTSFQATPILVDGLLYFPTPLSRLVALDPATGAEVWTHDPQIDRSEKYSILASRGVSFWRDRSGASELQCARRIFFATIDAFLLALDAATGSPCADFGADGRVDLNPGAGPRQWRGEYGVTSPPEVVGDRIVVGSMVSDNQRTDAPSGVVRAFDARTGDLIWAFDLSPPGFDHASRPTSDAGYALGTPNVWAPMSSDPKRDLVFVPTGNPAPDYYRGQQQDMDYFGSSVVALRAATGEVVWRFQTTHRDRWDYDVPAQPTLVDLVHDGRPVPALVQATKVGLLFVLNRETGEPVFGVEERPVPQGGAPGETLSPTQPFPVKPPPLVPLEMPRDGWGLTRFDQRSCAEKLSEWRYEGVYTPPGEDWSVVYPAPVGGVNWGGVAVDPERKRLYVNTSNIAIRVKLIPRETYARGEGGDGALETAPQTGTPYAMARDAVLSNISVPCNPPPWGRLHAVDLQTGELAWEVPYVGLRDFTPIPLDIDVGMPSLGGPLATAGGLLFIGAGPGHLLWAFDTETGEELWQGALPAGGNATPMTYRVEDTEHGPRQFVVIAAGGHHMFHAIAGDDLSDTLVAFALPVE